MNSNNESKSKSNQEISLAPNMFMQAADVTSSTLNQMYIKHCIINNSDFLNSLFNETLLQGCRFNNSTFDDSLFENCSLRNVRINNCDTEGLMVNGIQVGNILKLLFGSSSQE